MKYVYLYNKSGKSSTTFIKVEKIEQIEGVTVRNDKNGQVIKVDNHPELNYLQGRPFALCFQEIAKACRKEESYE